ncbi:MAG: sn-glycerol-1-phosphate dehydrogenase [Ruminococcaceae bacterium]|nr:sn-glycerol-1-phosphate dehydrogenase [Oscillospiraceae bacterium]
MNFPDNIIDTVDIRMLSKMWERITEIVKSIPSYEECLRAMETARCKTTLEQIGVTESFFCDCEKYSPYMRKRLTILRMKDMIEISNQTNDFGVIV